MKIPLLINVKMPTIVGIFIFISRETVMLSWVEHEKRFIISGPEHDRLLWLYHSKIQWLEHWWFMYHGWFEPFLSRKKILPTDQENT